MAEVAVQPGDEWDVVRDELAVTFHDRLDVPAHYSRVVSVWDASETYTACIDDLLEADDESAREEHRERAAEAGQELMETLGEGSYGLTKLHDSVDAIFRSIHQEGDTDLVSSPELTTEEVIDLVESGYTWIAEEMYVPSIERATYKEERMYRDRTLLERAWEAEEDRVAQNRIKNALELIQNNPGRHSRESTEWASTLLNALEAG